MTNATQTVASEIKEMLVDLQQLASEKDGELKAREVTAEAIYIMQLIEDLIRTDFRLAQMDAEMRGELQKSYKTCCELARKLPTLTHSDFWRNPNESN